MSGERMDLSDARRELEERLAELEPPSLEAEAAKPAFKREVQFLRLQLGALDLFERVSRELGKKAMLEVIRHDPPAPERSLRLTPTNSGAARIEAYLEPDDTIYLSVGVAGWVEMWARPRKADDFIDNLEDWVRAIVRGDVEEVYWVPRGGSEGDVGGSKLYVLLGGKRRRVGKLGVWRPLRRANKVRRKYEDY